MITILELEHSLAVITDFCRGNSLAHLPHALATGRTCNRYIQALLDFVTTPGQAKQSQNPQIRLHYQNM